VSAHEVHGDSKTNKLWWDGRVVKIAVSAGFWDRLAAVSSRPWWDGRIVKISVSAGFWDRLVAVWERRQRFHADWDISEQRRLGAGAWERQRRLLHENQDISGRT
jgi:hypothetical protein